MYPQILITFQFYVVFINPYFYSLEMLPVSVSYSVMFSSITPTTIPPDKWFIEFNKHSSRYRDIFIKMCLYNVYICNSKISNDWFLNCRIMFFFLDFYLFNHLTSRQGRTLQEVGFCILETTFFFANFKVTNQRLGSALTRGTKKTKDDKLDLKAEKLRSALQFWGCLSEGLIESDRGQCPPCIARQEDGVAV